MQDRGGAAWSEQQVAKVEDARGRRTSPTREGIRRDADRPLRITSPAIETYRPPYV